MISTAIMALLAVMLLAYLASNAGMLWTIAWSTATGGAVTDQAVALKADQTMPVDSGSNPLFPIPMYGVWWWAGGATLTRVRINAPKFRGVVRPLIRPIDATVSPSTRPIIMEAWRRPLLYNATEPIQPLQSDTAAETPNIVGTFGDLQFNVSQGDMYTARWTTTFTTGVGVWTAAPNIVFDDTLPTGVFEIQGLDTFLATLVAARVVFLGPALPGVVPNVRPGGVFPTANNSQSTRYWRYGRLGPFGQFRNTALPTMEYLDTAAVANPEGYFDIVKVG